VAVADGGGRVPAALEPRVGAESIAEFLLAVASRATELELTEQVVNGQPGLVARQAGSILTVFAFDVAGDRITRIWAVRNPEKLTRW
jgi:RNA polymerase sigma-70 factor (ECF subfamily)